MDARAFTLDRPPSPARLPYSSDKHPKFTLEVRLHYRFFPLLWLPDSKKNVLIVNKKRMFLSLVVRRSTCCVSTESCATSFSLSPTKKYSPTASFFPHVPLTFMPCLRVCSTAIFRCVLTSLLRNEDVSVCPSRVFFWFPKHGRINDQQKGNYKYLPFSLE